MGRGKIPRRGEYMPTIIIAGTQTPTGEIAISIERTPLVLAELRKALPTLRRDLRERWPVLSVGIENRIPRRRNPIDPSEVVRTACIVLAIRFGYEVAGEAGKKVGKTIGTEVSKYLRRWLKGFSKRRKK
jgi:hypothetical protein